MNKSIQNDITWKNEVLKQSRKTCHLFQLSRNERLPFLVTEQWDILDNPLSFKLRD